MQTILIISADDAKIETYLKKIYSEENISPFDIQTITSGEGESKKSSIGIAEIRAMQKTVFLMPSQGKKKAVIINHADTLTVEAQNALLKLLEEPPEHTIIVLTAKDKEALLPTTRSRCTIIELDRSIATQKAPERLSIEDILQASLGQRLKIAQDAAKQDPLGFVETFIVTIGNDLVNTVNHNEKATAYLSMIDKLQTAQKTLKTTQANPRLLLENVLLSI